MISNISPAFFRAYYPTATLASPSATAPAAAATAMDFRSAVASSSAWDALAVSGGGARPIIRQDELSVPINHYSVEEVKQMCAELDEAMLSNSYDGLTDVEIYTKIYQQVEAKFGEGFDQYIVATNPGNYGTLLYTSQQHKAQAVINRELERIGLGWHSYGELNKQMLYGDMSDEEITQAIIDSYPKYPEMTFGDLQYMAEDFRTALLGDELWELVNLMECEYSYTPQGNMEMRALPLNIRDVALHANAHIAAGDSFQFARTLAPLFSNLFGFTQLANGFFITPFDDEATVQMYMNAGISR